MTKAHILDSRVAWVRLLVSPAAAIVSGAEMLSVALIMPAVEAEFDLGRGTAALAFAATTVGAHFGTC